MYFSNDWSKSLSYEVDITGLIYVTTETTTEKLSRHVSFWGSEAGGLVARLRYSAARPLASNRLG